MFDSTTYKCVSDKEVALKDKDSMMWNKKVKRDHSRAKRTAAACVMNRAGVESVLPSAHLSVGRRGRHRSSDHKYCIAGHGAL